MILSAWYGGFGPALVTTGLSAFFSAYFFTSPAMAMVRFLVGAIGFSWLIPALIEVRRQARVQQRWAEVTLASIGDAVLTTDTEGRISFMNPAASAMTGWDAAEAVGRKIGSVFRIVNEQTNAPVENPIDRVLREGVVAGLANHTVLQTKSGARVPIDDSGAPIKDDEGRITGAVLIFRDISERRKVESQRKSAEEQLARSEKRLASILESISDGFVALDSDWRYTYVNAEAARLAQMPGDAMIGRRIWELFPQTIDSALFHELHRSMKEQTPVTCETSYGDRPQTLRIRAYPAPDGVSMYIVDISKEKEAATATALLAAIVESSSDAIIGTDLRGRIASWNIGAERIYGYTAADVIGRPVSILAPPGMVDELPGILEQVRRGERVEPYETLRRAQDGRLVDVSLSVSPIYDGEGRIIGASKVARDITDRKAAEQALRTSEARLSMALEAGSMGVWEWDTRSGRVVWSPQIEIMHGIEPGTFGGTFEDFERHIHPDDRHRVVADLRKAVDSRAGYSAEYRVKRPNENILWVEARGRLIPDQRGEPVRMIGVCMDVTARKTVEEELLQHADQLARENADLKDLTYAASHDLQEPLRNIATSAQLFKKRYGGLDTAANELISYVVDSAMRMGNLIHDLLGYSRIINAGETLSREVPLKDAVDAALQNVQAAIVESGATVDVGPLPVLYGDRVQFSQLFQNLISNAIKYRGQEPPRISIRAEARDHEWLLSVADNGQGIDPEYHERIFGVFKRLHGSEYPGTGIGLAICKRIVEKHGGRIWVESRPGQGSTFHFSIATQASEASTTR